MDMTVSSKCLTQNVSYILTRIANFETEDISGQHISSVTDKAASASKRYMGPAMTTKLTWELVDWLCSITSLPVLVKGVLTGMYEIS